MNANNVLDEHKNAIEFALRCSESDIVNALKTQSIPFLSFIPIALARNRDDLEFVEKICIKLSSQKDIHIRGNSILSLGYLAEIHGEIINKEIVHSIVETALNDENDFVRSQAINAADDLRDFLGWKFNRNEQQID